MSKKKTKKPETAVQKWIREFEIEVKKLRGSAEEAAVIRKLFRYSPAKDNKLLD